MSKRPHVCYSIWQGWADAVQTFTEVDDAKNIPDEIQAVREALQD